MNKKIIRKNKERKMKLFYALKMVDHGQNTHRKKGNKLICSNDNLLTEDKS